MLVSNTLKYIFLFSVLLFGIAAYSPVQNPTQGFAHVPIDATVEVVEKVAVDVKQLACLATNIFYEAGNEPLVGQAAVARVVMNRVKYGFARTPCAVIYQAATVEKVDEDGESLFVKVCQFSWVCEGKPVPNKNNAKYKQAEQIAHDVLANDAYKEVVPKSTLFFHSTLVNPLWAYRQVAVIGNHIFYSKERAKKA
jgi:spore germination cell wall hydrolase CwlJ-like protein